MLSVGYQQVMIESLIKTSRENLFIYLFSFVVVDEVKKWTKDFVAVFFQSLPPPQWEDKS